MEDKRAWIYCRTAYPDAFALAAQQASGMNLSRRGRAEVSGAVAAGEVDLLLVKDLFRLGRDVTGVDAYLRWLEDQFVDVVCADGSIPQTGTEILLALMKESGALRWLYQHEMEYHFMLAVFDTLRLLQVLTHDTGFASSGNLADICEKGHVAFNNIIDSNMNGFDLEKE